MDLSIVIPHRNRKDALRRCLGSIPLAAGSLSYETIVVDNGSRDGSQEVIRRTFPKVHLLQNQNNEGFSRAVNQGLRKAAGNYLLCLNNDTFLFPNSLVCLLSFMEMHPDAGISGGKIFNRDGTIQPSARSFPRLETALFNRSSLATRFFPNNPLSRRYLLSDWDRCSVREVDWVSGSFLMIRRSVFEKVGFFDERFFLYCEDVDYCRRAKEMGFRVYYVPDSHIIHETSYSGKGLSTLFFHHQSMYRFYKKHYSGNFLRDTLILGGVTLRFLVEAGSLPGKRLFWKVRHDAAP